MNSKYTSILLYDIPSKSKEEVKLYSKFRKKILAEGYYQLQESVYIKVIANKSVNIRIANELKLLAPLNSNIRMLLLPEKTFERIEVIAGELSISEKIVKKDIKIIEI